MKRMLSLMLALLCCVTAFAALAEDYSGYTTEELLAMSAAINAELSARISVGRTASPAADFVWASDGTQVQINAYVGPGGDVVIPDEIDGLPVTRIGVNAFDRNQNVTGVSLPSGIEQIGDGAFHYCFKLAGVLELPISLKSVGSECFTLTDLEGIIIDGTFSGKTGITPFGFLSELEFVYIRKGSEVKLNNGAFRGCDKLVVVIIPETVTSISGGALLDCPMLRIITPAGSAAETYAKNNWIPVETDTYELYAAQYDALYPMPE